MPKIKVPIAGTVGKSVRIDADANQGATLGVDLKLEDGSIATAATLAAALGVGAAGDADASPTLWKLIREIPANVIQVENLATSGLVTRLADGSWVTRDLETDDGTFISVSNPGGELGNPSVDVDFAANILWTGQHQFDLGPTVWDGALYQDVVLDTRQIIAGAGLTGTSDLSADVTLAVGAGVGIAVNADDVALSHLGLEALTDPAADRIIFWDDSVGATGWLSIGAGLDLTDTTLSFSLLGLEDLVDPDADRVLFWDDSAGAAAWLTIGDGLTITDTTLDGVDLLDDLSDVDLTSVQQGETWYFASPTWQNTNQVEILIDNADGPFQQALGMLSIEAENFHTNTGRSSRDWTEVTSPVGFSGAGAMQALPDGGTNITTNIPTTAPEMEYEVIFEETGTHYVWVRGVGVDSGGDSYTFGLDGSVIIQQAIGDQGGVDYVWSLATSTNIATAGAHIVNIWMREDGTIVDKIVITTDSEFTPTGTGPAESGRAGTANGVRLSLDTTAVLDTVVQDSMPGIQLDPVNDGSLVLTGAGSPEGVVTATQGSLFLRTDGGADTSVYVKESGTGNTGWVAK